jgi:hypothetical protein
VVGETIPVAVGEAAPESGPGQTQARLKESGVGAAGFKELEHAQQTAVKRAIRRVAEKTTGESMIFSLDEPGKVMGEAARVTFDRARPMYTALDGALRTLPANFKNVSQLVRTAMGRAEKLGVKFDGAQTDISAIRPGADGTIVLDGGKISKAAQPIAWARLVEQGIIDDSGQGTPLSAALKVRSELLRVQRGTADAAMRNAIGNEVRGLNDSIEAALKPTGLHADWLEANRLWAKGYALRDVADAISESTKGTPVWAQAPGLAKVPVKMQGAGLVARLNTLADDGILNRAFTPSEARNLRQAADILDRIQRTPVGKGGGGSITRGLGHVVRGVPGPLIGAGVGGALGAITGGLRGAFEGAGIGAGLGSAAQFFGERMLAKVMTTTDGVKALRAIQAARTPAAMQSAMKSLAAAAAASGAGQRAATLKELNAEAKERRPVGAAY